MKEVLFNFSWRYIDVALLNLMSLIVILCLHCFHRHKIYINQMKSEFISYKFWSLKQPKSIKKSSENLKKKAIKFKKMKDDKNHISKILQKNIEGKTFKEEKITK